MIEQLQGTISPLLIESVIESALLWVLAVLFLRIFRVAEPALRVAVFSLPLLLPVAITTVFHVLVPVRPYDLPHFKPFEVFIGDLLPLPSSVLMVFLLAGAAGIVASVSLVFHHGLAWARAHRAWQGQQQDDSELCQRCTTTLEALSTRLGIAVPRLVLAAGSGARSLSVMGSSYILVPPALAERLDQEELEALLSHEMAHIRRKDSLLRLLARICCNLMLLNPLAHLALVRLEKEQELAADDLAVNTGDTRLALASCLLKGYRFGGYRIVPGWAGLVGNYGSLGQRVRRMMGAPVPEATRAVRLSLMVGAGITSIVFALAL